MAAEALAPEGHVPGVTVYVRYLGPADGLVISSNEDFVGESTSMVQPSALSLPYAGVALVPQLADALAGD